MFPYCWICGAKSVTDIPILQFHQYTSAWCWGFNADWTDSRSFVSFDQHGHLSMDYVHAGSPFPGEKTWPGEILNQATCVTKDFIVLKRTVRWGNSRHLTRDEVLNHVLWSCRSNMEAGEHGAVISLNWCNAITWFELKTASAAVICYGRLTRDDWILAVFLVCIAFALDPFNPDRSLSKRSFHMSSIPKANLIQLMSRYNADGLRTRVSQYHEVIVLCCLALLWRKTWPSWSRLCYP